MRKYEDSLPLQILKARDSIMSYFRPLLQKYGITEQQWRIMRALYDSDEMEPKQISLKCCILGPSLTGVVNRLEKNGYIVRRRPAEDQRRTLISMTPEARDFFGKLSPEIDEAYVKMRKKFSPELIDQIHSLCRKIEEIDSL